MATPGESSGDEDRQFTPAERKAIRKMLENDARVSWLWASARVWAGWISAFTVGAFAIHQALQGWFPTIFKKVGGP